MIEDLEKIDLPEAEEEAAPEEEKKEESKGSGDSTQKV